MSSGVPRKRRNIQAVKIQATKCASFSNCGLDKCGTDVPGPSGCDSLDKCDLKYLKFVDTDTLLSFYLYGSHGPKATFGGFANPSIAPNNKCPGIACPWGPLPNLNTMAVAIQVRPPTNKFLHENDVLKNSDGKLASAPVGFFRVFGSSEYKCTPAASTSRDWAIQYHWGPFPVALSDAAADNYGICRASRYFASGGVITVATSSGFSSRGLLYMHCGGKSGYIPCVHTPKTGSQFVTCSFKIVGPEADTSMTGAWVSSSLACTACVDQPAPLGMNKPPGAEGTNCYAAMKAPPNALSHVRIGVYGSIGSGSFLNIYCSGSASGPANDGWGVLTGTFSGEDHALANAGINETPNYYRKFFKIPTGSLPIQLSFTASNAETTAKAGLQIYWAPDS